MKKLYFTPIVIFLLSLSSNFDLEAQCYVWFHTYTNLCDLNTVILEADPQSGVAPFTFLWETGETTQSILIPNVLGDYMLTMTDATGCTSIINCHVKMWPNPVWYPFTDYACEGDSVLLYLDWIRDEIPGLLYEWPTGETSDSIWVTESITWNVTVTDPETGCEYVTEDQEVEFDPRPDPEIIGSTEICDGQSIVLTLENGPFEYITWYPNYEWEESITVTAPGLYWVEVYNSDNFWCYGRDSIIVSEGEIPQPLITGPPDLCEGQTGMISITNEDEFATFNWSNGETAHEFLAEDPGTYTVTVTDAAGCQATESYTIEDAIENELMADPEPAVCGLSNGSIIISYSISGSYSYEWSNGTNTQNLENVPSGLYAVTVTDSEGCSSTLESEIPEYELPIVINETITPNNSCEEFNGSINLFVTPEEEYSFVWSNGESTEDLLDLAAGNYSVTVSYGETCQEYATYFVDDISAAPDLQTSVTAPSCGEANGEIDLILTGGNAPFSYSWSNGNSSEDLSAIYAGSYTVTVTASDGCSAILTTEVPDNATPIDITGTVSPNTSCNSPNGNIDVTLNPSASYDIVWSNGETTEDLSGLGEGTYIINASLGGCSQSDTFTVVSQSLPFSITGNTLANTSCLSGNGSIDIYVTPSGSYTFQWSGGSSNEDLQNLQGGSYTVTVTNNSGCSITSTFIVDNISNPFSISGLSIANTSCQIPNGMVNITASPVADYTYAWSTGSVSEDLQNVGAGTYSVTVTNNEGCYVDTSFNVVDQSASFSVSANISPDTSCSTPSGALDLTITPSGAYTYVWSTGAITEDLQGLSGGSYSVTVSDMASACSSTAEFTIESESETPSVTSLITSEVCGESNGAIDITVSIPVTSITWSNGSTSQDISNLSAGSYHVTIVATNGCSVKDTFTVANTSNSFTISSTPTDNSSCINPNGLIDLTVIPAGTYTYAWSTGAITEDLTNLSAGTYSVTVVDHLNCSSTETFTLLSNTPDPLIEPVINPSTCAQNNGAINLTISPSTGNTYLWSNGSTEKDLQNLAGGNYSITVTASNGCTAFADIEVPDHNSHAEVSGIITSNTSCTTNNGAVNITVNPPGAYSYAWSNGSAIPDLQSIPGGDYTVTITDQYQCEFIETFVISDDIILPEISYVITPANCGQPDGGIDLTISLTTNNTFLWSNNQSGEDINAVLPGTYSVTVTSHQGCIATAIIDVPNENSNFTIESLVVDNSSCAAPTGSIDVNVTPGGAYTFNWSTGAITEDLDQLTSGIYSVTVTDLLNCSTSEEFIIEDVTVLPVLSFEVTPASCGNKVGFINLDVTPGSSLNQFTWSTGDTVEDLGDLASGSYSVTVTDENGCTAKGDFLVPGTEPIELNIDADLLAVPVGGNVLCSLQLNVPLAAIDSILWFPQNMLSCTDPLCLEQYLTLNEQTEISVMVNDTNGCYGQAFLMLNILEEYRVYIPNVFTPKRGGENDNFTIYTNEDVEEIVVLEIFDRWGNCVFINQSFPPNEPNYGWDGTFSDEIMNPDVFAYRAVVRFGNGEEHRYKGDVTLVR